MNKFDFADGFEGDSDDVRFTVTKYYENVIRELVETERKYVDDLRDICEVYIPCIRHLDTLSERDIHLIFNNMVDIYVFSRELLEQLDKEESDVAKILNVFNDKTRFSSVYSPYCTNYPRSNMKLESVLSEDHLLSVILKDIQSSLSHPLPLASYLHKPVQRILKYHLLLKTLHDSLEGDSLHLKDQAHQAYCVMSDVARVIDESKRVNEMDVETRNLHRFLIDTEKKQSFGNLVREAEMKVYDSTATTKLQGNVYLYEKVIVICYREDEESLSIKNIIQCDNMLVVEEIKSQPKVFSIVPFDNPARAVYLEANSLPQKVDWCIQIDKLARQNIPSKAKKLLIASPLDAIIPKIVLPLAMSKRAGRASFGSMRDQANNNTDEKLKKGLWRSLSTLSRRHSVASPRFSSRTNSKHLRRASASTDARGRRESTSRSSRGKRRASADDDEMEPPPSPVSSGLSAEDPFDPVESLPSSVSRSSTGTGSITSASSEVSNYFNNLVNRMSAASIGSENGSPHSPECADSLLSVNST